MTKNPQSMGTSDEEADLLTPQSPRASSFIESSEDEQDQQDSAASRHSIMDQVLETIGTGGAFQVALVCAIQSVRFIALWGIFFITFGIFTPDWQCADCNGGSVYMGMPTMNQSLMGIYQSLDETSGYPASNVSNQSMASDSVCETNTCNCSDVSFISGTSTLVTEWSLICGRAWFTSLITFAQLGGDIIGAIIAGQASESIGRKPTFYVPIAVFGLAHLLSIFSHSPEIYIVIRFIIGMCTGAVNSVAFVYASEFLGQKGRGILSALSIWNFSLPAFSVVVYLLRDWKQIHIVTSVVSILVLLTVFWAPESIRWLYAHGRTQETNKIVRKISLMNKSPECKIKPTAKTEKFNLEQKHSYLDLFRGRTMAYTTMAGCAIPFCLGIVYFVIGFGVSSFSGDFYLNFVLFSLAELPTSFILLPVVRYMSRRHAGLLFIALPFTCCVGIVIVTEYVTWDYSGTVINVLALVAKASVQGCKQIFLMFITELYPTVLRGHIAALTGNIIAVGGILAPFIIPSSPAVFTVTFLAMGGLLLVSAVLWMSLPETKNRTLYDRLDSPEEKQKNYGTISKDKTDGNILYRSLREE